MESEKCYTEEILHIRTIYNFISNINNPILETVN